MNTNKITSIVFGLMISLSMSCAEQEDISSSVPAITNQKGAVNGNTAASIGLVGDAGDVSRQTEPGTVLMGGGADVDEAIEWMIDRSGGGDFVVLRASGGDGYNDYIYGLGNVNSVETLLIDSRSLANNSGVETAIRNAEAVFIAGGDQYDYVSFWKDTKVESALNYLINTKEVPVGGTSAGCAIQGEAYFDAANGTVYSNEALRNPYNSYMSLQEGNFLDVPYLESVITDTHYDNPDRRGRHITFMARMNKDWGMNAKGIGVDEATAVCIDENGRGYVFGDGTAFFLNQNGQGPERCQNRKSLDWYRNRQAIRAHLIQGNSQGNRYFNLASWSPGSGESSQYYYVDRGRLKTSN
ncbi:MAG: cyanophycinase [Reichenbachiella sp.]|uniref:cyanophycinase n=1 Tax=Reichenbachiella sp. TaxID=2184521 RepID=UPI00296641ED|nr:cyanophycinase [Reichenbachiella sp.]MDW3212030.1 cyanophycinase [Reichenbachiella sp.]